MFLTRLDTVGFKSFAERIQMDFVPGITAVVGPNGSGKSNVIDAIRWVLGEQSARSLRGQKMEDVIFQGSDTRRALNFAEVTLVLDNSHGQLPLDYQEIQVTRRVYRSGESEFHINKQACRLKDIVDLFMDTGLGRESFSIIGQGKIDEILSSKAEERRAVFEEAAGVLKYKQRKHKAEYKLSETADNLDRVKDIIHEIEHQIAPLKKQAETAKKYKTKQAALQQVEVALLVTEIDSLHVEWQTLRRQSEQDQLAEIKSRTDIQEKQAGITRDKEKLQQLDDELTSLQEKLLALTEQLEQTEGKRNVLKERSSHMEKNKQTIAKEQQHYRKRISETNQKKEMETKTFHSIMTQIKTCKKEIAELKKTLIYGLDMIKEKIEDKKADYIERLNEQAVLQNENEAIEKALQKMSEQTNEKQSVRQETIHKEAALKSKKQSYEQALRSETKQMDQMQKELEQLKQSVIKERKEYEIMQQKRYEGNEKIAALASKKTMLEDMKDAFQGYFYGVKEILRAKQQGGLTDVHGVVLDLISVPNEYMTAIDTVLGAQSQYVVVSTDRSARDTIAWLKKENKGRATFLPLESIAERNFPQEMLHRIKTQQGFIGIASDLIQTAGVYQKVLNHLLGNVIIADQLKNANQLAKLTHRRFRIVTLEGDMVYPGGSMSGGARKNQQASLFTREKEIQEITKKLASYRPRAKKYDGQVQQQKQLVQNIEKHIVSKEAEIEQIKQQIQKQQTVYHDILIDYRAMSDRLTTLHVQSEEHKTEEERLVSEQQENNQTWQELKQTILYLENEIERLSAEEINHQKKAKQTEKQLHEREVHLAGLEERRKAQLEQLDRLNQQSDELNEGYEAIQQQLDGMMNEEELQQLAQSLEQQIVRLKNDRHQLNQTVEQKRQARYELLKRSEDDENEVKGLTYQLEKLVKEMQEREVQVNRLDVALDHRLSVLQNEYLMTYEKAMTLYDKVEHVEEAKEQVAEIKYDIKQLGSVNLGAIDEFERLNERYAFLQEQQTDLADAKQTLYAVIQEMDGEMTKRFQGVFTEIQQAFTAVFNQLFGGGEAKLELTDPEHILDTGIEITAKPPGKKLKNLSLLSGGERALTAIALLFAILKVRPVPFCILDEVDAALDETNVDRFSSYLKAFSKDTQFIVITHRRGTMEDASALYGITMQESGVSRLVSVKLEDTKQLIESR